jgi:mRNA interferase RelE/StbE
LASKHPRERPPFRIELKPSAVKTLAGLERRGQIRIGLKIDALAANPRPQGVRKLEGTENVWRLRVGDYRILYAIEDAILRILVIRIGHRREVYRR